MKTLIILLTIFISGCGITNQIGEDVISNNWFWVDQTYIPDNYEYTTPNTIVILGNSIAYHHEKASIDWYQNNGMSASSPDKDYSHILAELIGADLIVENHWDIESGYITYDFSTLPDGDMIIIQLGDNLGEGRDNNYCLHLDRMVKRYKGKQIILTSTIIYSKRLLTTDAQIQKVARDNNIPYIDVRNVMINKSNNGIYFHPNDKGMRLIAERIYKEIK